MPAEIAPPWWVLTTHAELEQGDVIRNLKIDQPEGDAIKEVLIDALILTQSCDLVHDAKGRFKIGSTAYSVKNVLFARLITEEDQGSERYLRDGWKNIVAGKSNGMFALPGLPESGLSKCVVDFADLYLMPLEAALQYALTQRPRMNHPYRQALSQSFGRSIMRVEIPGDDPRRAV